VSHPTRHQTLTDLHDASLKHRAASKGDESKPEPKGDDKPEPKQDERPKPKGKTRRDG